MNCYFHYKAEDLLTDDYFIESVKNPTTESETHWQSLVDRGDIEVEELQAAKQLVFLLGEKKTIDLSIRLRILWARIQEINNRNDRRRKRIKFSIYLAAASIALFLIVKPINQLLFEGDVCDDTLALTEFASQSIIHTCQPNEKIELMSGKKVIQVDGALATVDYSKGLVVNKKKLSNENVKKTEYDQLRVPYGKQAFLTLSDGTKLWVNTGSTVTYPSVFSEGKREIYVDGEVFLEVAHDKTKPFVVHTGKLDVEVLGTTFNVSSYKDDKESSVVLVDGSVNVKPLMGESIIIKPNQQFLLREQTKIVQEVDVENYISWRNGIYIFKNESIDRVLLRLARYYNVTIKLPSNSSNITCSGKLELKDEFIDLLSGIAEVANISYVMVNNEYSIRY